jgi:hypothetical protein
VSRSLKAHILLVAITMIWGLTFVVIKSALADISPALLQCHSDESRSAPAGCGFPS